MEAREILNLVDSSELLRRNFKGIYPNHAYPENLECGSYILNSERAGSAGGHWLAVHKSTELDLVLFFDSLGRSPKAWLMDFPGQVVLFNDIRIQPEGSNLCGLYSLYFIYLKHSNWSMLDIIDTFKREKNNDIMMLNFAAELAAGHL